MLGRKKKIKNYIQLLFYLKHLEILKDLMKLVDNRRKYQHSGMFKKKKKKRFLANGLTSYKRYTSRFT